MTTKDEYLNNMMKLAVGSVIILMLAGFVGLKSFTRIPAGYVGVVYSPNGGVQDKVLTQGWNFINPFKKVTQYTIGTEQAYLSADAREGSSRDDSFQVPTSDGKIVNIDLEFSYRFDPDQVTAIFTRFKGKNGSVIESTYIRGKIKAYVAEVTSTFNVLDIYGAKRSELNRKAFEHIRDKFEKDGIIIESVNFSRIGLDSDTEQAIQQRVNSQQELERQKIEKEKARIEAEKKAIEEQGKANVKIIEANAEAERILTIARAEATANKLKRESISKELIQYEEVLKWDGRKPQVIGGNTITDIRER